MKFIKGNVFKKITALIMAVTCVFAISVPAFAMKSTYVWVNGIKLVSGDWLENGQTEKNTGSVHNMAYTDGVLTLNNAVIDTAYTESTTSYGIFTYGDVDIVLSGTNIIATENNDVARNYGINIYGSITFSGDGTLNLTSQATSAYKGYIGIFGSNITFSNNVHIISKGGVTDEHGLGMGINAVNVLIKDNADVTVSCGVGETYNSNYGIRATDIEIKDSASVTASCEEGGESNGLYATHDITITDNTTVISSSGKTTGSSRGIYSGNDITISKNATVNSFGGNNSDTSYGIFSYNNVNITDTATVLTSDGKDSADGYGISAAAKITISNTSSVEALGTTSAFNNEPDLTAYENAAAKVNTLRSSEGTVEWNGTDALGGTETEFKYTKIRSEEKSDISLVSAEVVNGNELKITVDIAVKRDNPNSACIACVPVFETGSANAGKMLGAEFINIPADGNANVTKTVTLQIPKPSGNQCRIEYYLLSISGVPVQDAKTLDITF